MPYISIIKLKIMKNLMLVLVLLVSGLSYTQSLIVIDPDKTQSMSVKGKLGVFDMMKNGYSKKSDPDKSLDDVFYIFDFENGKCEFFRFGRLVSTVTILNVEDKEGLLHIDCDDRNIRTGGKIITHYILNPHKKEGYPFMIYHFYWDDIDTTYAEVTLSLK